MPNFMREHGLQFRLGELRIETGEIEKGRAILEEGLRLSRELDDPELTAKMLGTLGVAARDEGDHATAATLFEQACALHRSGGNRFNLAVNLQKVGMARIDSGQLDEAAAPLREALEIFREFRNEFEISFVLEGLAYLIAADNPEAATRLLGKADALREPSNARLERGELHRVRRVTAETKSVLDAAQWEQEWNKGKRLSLADAVTDAIGPQAAAARP
jgi:tetratricopeptide (TPR) repeat protein